MPAPRDRQHLIVEAPPDASAFRPHPRDVKPREFSRPDDRARHAAALTTAFQSAERAREQSTPLVEVRGAERGLYIQFESQPGVELKLQSLENRRLGIELLTVGKLPDAPKPEQYSQLATVFVPDDARKHFLARFEEYATQDTKTGKARHRDLVDPIASLRRATLEALWTDALEAFPVADERVWWEVWLRRDEGRELERFAAFAQSLELTVGHRRLAFDDRSVVLVHATATQLAASLDVIQDLAELRLGKVSAAPFVAFPQTEAAAWIGETVSRTAYPRNDAPAVCLLDTGINRGHPLLEPLIAPADASAVDNTWGANDDGGGAACRGHGTSMGGIAVYGDLAPVLAGSDRVQLRHKLESVKVLPPTGANRPELYGAITAEAVARPEITAPQRKRVFALAVSAEDQRDRGLPTSWSSALDALAAGRSFDATTSGLVYLGEEERPVQRLFVVSSGNVVQHELQHLQRSDLECVHDPAQAWNVLTIGACTERALINDAAFRDWIPVARPGELSPWSTTSVPFVEGWPMKPELVVEGGNLATDGNSIERSPDLQLLSTNAELTQSLLTTMDGTSSATAEVARLAAIVMADYPTFWPETIRALLVHSARWSPAMWSHFDASGGRRRDMSLLLRRYGYGVPSLQRALRSASDSLTLVFQGKIHPYSKGAMREMHLHELPWPADALRELGRMGANVRLRATLSYFVEPNPSRRGWKQRHRYASHGLRFHMNQPGEGKQAFTKRLNMRALTEEESRPVPDRRTDHWLLGEEIRTRGSIHSDLWEGPASDLADCGVMGIYPVSGWWKDQPKRDRSALGARYSLVVGIETDAQDVDIWTPVAAQLNVPVET